MIIMDTNSRNILFESKLIHLLLVIKHTIYTVRKLNADFIFKKDYWGQFISTST